MGERDVDFAGDTYEEDDPYEHEKKVASFFSVAKEQAIRLAAQRYETQEAANEAAAKFVTTFSEIAGGTGALYHTEVHVQGLNVRVSNVVTEQTEDGRCILTVDQDEPYVLAERYSEPTGICYALNASLGQDEQGYFIIPMMTFIDTEPDEAILQVNQHPVANVSVTKYIIAPLNDSEFSVPVLDDVYRRRKVLSEVALKHREKPTELTTALTRITAAISNSNDRTFTPFEHVDSFHTLTRLPEDANVDEVLDMFRGVMGKGRQISMEAVAYEGVEVEEPRKLKIIGTFLDIVPSQETLGVGEPTLVISSAKEGEEQLVYVPLSRIEAFSF